MVQEGGLCGKHTNKPLIKFWNVASCEPSSDGRRKILLIRCRAGVVLVPGAGEPSSGGCRYLLASEYVPGVGQMSLVPARTTTQLAGPR